MASKAEEFDEIADQVFFPIYPVIAQQIKEKTGKTKGICLDVGSGGGHLGLSLLKITELEMILLDKNEEALEIAQKRIADRDLEARASTLLGDVQKIPLNDGVCHLVISRGSLWFWEDQKKALEEIYRVLAPRGMAYVGGGFGTPELEKQIGIEMRKRDKEWPQSRQKFVEGNNTERFLRLLTESIIEDFQVSEDEKGIWIFIKK